MNWLGGLALIWHCKVMGSYLVILHDCDTFFAMNFVFYMKGIWVWVIEHCFIGIFT